MTIYKIIKNKALPSFCSSNIDVLSSILFFCNLKKLPCLIECTSNQVNQHGGYTGYTAKTFFREIQGISKKINFNKKMLFLGGDHLGPLPWKNKTKKIALKNSIKLIDDFLKYDYCKIHVDTSIKCKDDQNLDNEIIFYRTKEILNNKNIKKKIKNKFIIIGTEVPLSGSGDSNKIIVTKKSQIKEEVLKFKRILKSLKLKSKKFGLVIEPGMKYMHSSIKKPILKDFRQKKILSKKYSIIYEAHSTDYQSIQILKKLVNNNFKFLKVGPELTFNYARSLFYMHQIEKKFFKIQNSNLNKQIFRSMIRDNRYWKGYYNPKNKKIFLNSKLDRMRYYFSYSLIKKSIKILQKNINNLKIKDNLLLLKKDLRKEFNEYHNYGLKNFEILKLIFISKTLKKYYNACGYKTN